MVCVNKLSVDSLSEGSMFSMAADQTGQRLVEMEGLLCGGDLSKRCVCVQTEVFRSAKG